jgi:short-subunit dehydrogenase
MNHDASFQEQSSASGPLSIILITGASRGIGQACAVALAAPGRALALTSRREEDLVETQALCQARGARAERFACDLSNMESIDDLVDEVKARLGGPIHALINNAGIWIEQNIETGPLALWEEALDVNLKAPMRLTRRALEGMLEGGSIIFIGSAASKRSYANGSNYCAAKHGLLGFANALFEDVRERGVKVCSVLPGVVDTDMHASDPLMDHAKMIQPEDVAAAVVFAMNTPAHVCPVEIALQPQRAPKRRS